MAFLTFDGNNATMIFSESFKTPHLIDNLCEMLLAKLKEYHFEMIAVGIPGVYDLTTIKSFMLRIYLYFIIYT